MLNESRKSYERLLEKAEAQRSAEPAPAEVYPETLGQQEKADTPVLTPVVWAQYRPFRSPPRSG